MRGTRVQFPTFDQPAETWGRLLKSLLGDAAKITLFEQKQHPKYPWVVEVVCRKSSFEFFDELFRNAHVVSLSLSLPQANIWLGKTAVFQSK
jgi:hypothetical protein